MGEWDVSATTPSNSHQDIINKHFPKDAETAGRIATAESSGDPAAVNRNKNGTWDHGLFQINDSNIPRLKKAGIIKNTTDLYDPEINTRAAAHLHSEDGFTPWDSSRSKWDTASAKNAAPKAKAAPKASADAGWEVDDSASGWEVAGGPGDKAVANAKPVGEAPKRNKTLDERISLDWRLKHPVLTGLVGAGEALGQAGLEVGGTLGGAALGGAATAETFGLGAIPGAGVGYTTGKRAGQYLGLSDEPIDNSAKGLAKDTALGMAFQILPEFLKPAFKAVRGAVTGVGDAVTKGLFPSEVAVARETGQVAPKGLTMAEKLAARDLVSRMPKKGTTGSALIDANIEQAEKLKGAMDIPFSLASETEAPGIIKGQKALTTRSKSAGLTQDVQKVEQHSAIADNLNNIDTEGANISNTLEALSKKGEALTQDEEAAQRALQQRLEGLNNQRQALIKQAQDKNDRIAQEYLNTKDKEAWGKNALDQTHSFERAMAARQRELYENIPTDVNLDTKPLADIIKAVQAKDPNVIQLMKDLPDAAAEQILNKLTSAEESELQGFASKFGTKIEGETAEPVNLTIGEIRELDSYLGRLGREATSRGQFNTARRFHELQKGIDDVFEAAKKTNPEAIDAIEAATSFTKNEYAPLFRDPKQPSYQVLARNESGASELYHAQMADKYFQAGGKGGQVVENYMKVFGDDVEPLRELAKRDLLTEANKGQWNAGKANNWLYNHKSALEKAGLWDEFSSTVKTLKEAENLSKTLKPLTERSPELKGELKKVVEAAQKKRDFDRSAAGRMLKADPTNAVKAAFNNSGGNFLKVIKELKSYMGNDKAALNGLRDEFRKFMYDAWKSTAREDIAGEKGLVVSQLERFMSKVPQEAWDGLYSKDELKVIENCREAIKKIAAQDKPVLAGESGTAALLEDNKAMSRTREILNILGYVSKGAHAASMILDKGPGFAYRRLGVDDILERAYFDPEYAKVIMKAVQLGKTNTPTSQAAKQLYRSLAILGYNASESKEQPRPEQEKSPWPEGTRLQGEDGLSYTIKGGVPVPDETQAAEPEPQPAPSAAPPAKMPESLDPNVLTPGPVAQPEPEEREDHDEVASAAPARQRQIVNQGWYKNRKVLQYDNGDIEYA